MQYFVNLKLFQLICYLYRSYIKHVKNNKIHYLLFISFSVADNNMLGS